MNMINAFCHCKESLGSRKFEREIIAIWTYILHVQGIHSTSLCMNSSSNLNISFFDFRNASKESNSGCFQSVDWIQHVKAKVAHVCSII